MRLTKSVALFFSAFIMCSRPALALTQLQGQEAKDYLGDPKKHLLSGNYTCDVLTRSHRDSMHGRFSDAVVFNSGGGSFEFLKSKDGERDLVLDSPSGRQEEALTDDLWHKKIENTLSDDNNLPYVFLDDSKKELAVIFVGNGTQVNAKMTSQALLEIIISVEGAKDHRGRRRMMS